MIIISRPNLPDNNFENINTLENLIILVDQYWNDALFGIMVIPGVRKICVFLLLWGVIIQGSTLLSPLASGYRDCHEYRD